MTQPLDVVFLWSIGSLHGYGVYGLNLVLNSLADPRIRVIGGHPAGLGGGAQVDALRAQALRPFVQRTEALVEKLQRVAETAVTFDGVVLHAGDTSFTATTAAHGVRLAGRRTVTVPFVEHAQLAPDAVARAKRYDRVIAGSTWNADIFRAHGVDCVRVLQGVDTSLFHPAPAVGLLPDRFKVFSGGKVELRKGQDLVLAAFKIFADRHPDALLVTTWHSPWPQTARTLDGLGRTAPVQFTPNGRLDAVGWARAAGLRDDQFLDLGPTPNAQMPPILREMDVALFPNRCEGGTNLVAMEAMACGAPTILSANTGHLDLIGEENGYVLADQRPIGGVAAAHGGVSGWGESQVDEIVERLEQAYTDRAEARRRGARGAATLASMSWATSIRQLTDVLLALG